MEDRRNDKICVEAAEGTVSKKNMKALSKDSISSFIHY